VNGASGSCSDAGLGDLTQPFCTIGKGAAVAVAGDTVNVAPAVYREQVKPAQNGAAGLPITLRATVPNTLVLGTDNLSGAGTWTPVGGGVFVRSFVPASSPVRVVLVNGSPLRAATSLATLAPGGFFFDAGASQLYLNLGGADPGLANTEAGSRGFGFDLQPRSWIVVQGFQVGGQNGSAIRTLSSSTTVSANNQILDNVTAHTGQFGILVENTPGPNEVRGNETSGHVAGGIRLRNNASNTSVVANLVRDNAGHGIRLTDASDNALIGNTCARNGDVPNGVTESTGIDIDLSSHRNRVQANVTFGNADTGIEVTDANDTLVVRNLSFSNGDHGYDVRDNAGTHLISNTSYGNHNDGISVEGTVTSVRLANNVSAENGVFTNHYNLYVDAFSAAGFVGDYDLAWNSGAQTPIRFGGVLYASMADLTLATGQEPQGVTANPNFLNPAGSDFRPGLGPVVDSADASAPGFEALDLVGMPPLDIPAVANTGAGVPDYADRGALEAVDVPPVASLTVTPKKATRGVPVTANGSGSTDDFGIVEYRFSWGDGTPDTVQTTPIAQHTYTTKGNKKVRLTVMDASGQTSTVQRVVQVR
jgi:parallel beta-helix repeat protein